MARMLRIKARPGTMVTEVITVTIRIITTLGMVTVVVAIRIIRLMGV